MASHYKVVPGPSVIAGDICCGVATAGSATQLQQAANVVARIVEQEAQHGWRLHIIDETIVYNACFGCFSRQGVHIKLLVFVRNPAEPSHQCSEEPSSPAQVLDAPKDMASSSQGLPADPNMNCFGYARVIQPTGLGAGNLEFRRGLFVLATHVPDPEAPSAGALSGLGGSVIVTDAPTEVELFAPSEVTRIHSQGATVTIRRFDTEFVLQLDSALKASHFASFVLQKVR